MMAVRAHDAEGAHVNAGLGIDAPPCTVIVLAAGEGKRMRSALPKVLHPVLGRSMLGHVLACASGALPAARIVVVVGRGADQVREHLSTIAPDVRTALQAQQLGTGHAVRAALASLAAPEPEATPPGSEATSPGVEATVATVAAEAVTAAGGVVVVLNGDIPLLRQATLRALVDTHVAAGAAATVLTAEVADPKGLGRILRTADGGFAAIVEERDATTEQRSVREINAGAYVFDAAALAAGLSKLSCDNDQGEEYLTDVLGLLVAAGRPVAAYRAEDATDALGANDRAELSVLRAVMRDRINLAWMRSGVTIVDPATTWIDVTVTIGEDAVIEPNTQLRGFTRLGGGAIVGPDVTARDTVIGEAACVVRVDADRAVIDRAARVGPFVSLPPGSRATGCCGGCREVERPGPGVAADPGGGNDGSGSVSVSIGAGSQ